MSEIAAIVLTVFITKLVIFGAALIADFIIDYRYWAFDYVGSRRGKFWYVWRHYWGNIGEQIVARYRG